MASLYRTGARILLPSALLLAVAVAAGVLLHHISGALAAERHVAPAGHTPVIVELFTSEGCSSCPPADALLAHLQRDQPVASADVLALEEHVDYWDGLGWHDRFSSGDITARQSGYARRFQLDSNYTPQMVIDGTTQFVGNDSSQALQAITRAARTPKLALSIQALMLDRDRITGELTLPPSTPAGTDLYAALVQPMASTQVLHGENGGHTLNHVSVVRSLQRMPLPHDSAPAKFSLAVPQGLASTDLRVVVFLQRPGQGPILGAATSTLPASDEDAVVPELN
jgi:hypothetical protein